MEIKLCGCIQLLDGTMRENKFSVFRKQKCLTLQHCETWEGNLTSQKIAKKNHTYVYNVDENDKKKNFSKLTCKNKKQIYINGLLITDRDESAHCWKEKKPPKQCL